MTIQFLKLKNTALLTKCFVTLSGALVLSAAATRVEAATFRVDYKGTLDSISLITDDGENSQETPLELPSQPTSIVGNYTGEDTSGKLLSSRFKFLANNGDVIKDVTFTPGPPTYGANNNYGGPYAEVGEGYMTYLEDLDSPNGVGTQKLRIEGGFSYLTLLPDSSGQIEFLDYEGTLNELTTMFIKDPTSVPEPASVLGMLVLAGGAGISLQRRKSGVRA